jgi:ribose transport system substrate-binding protein
MPNTSGAARHVGNRPVHMIRTAVAAGLLMAAAGGLAACSSSSSPSGATTAATGNVGAGITKPIKLAPYTASASAGPTPNLPKVIAYAQDSSNETEQAVASGIQAGAKDAGLKFQVTNSNGDPQQQVQNMQQLLVTGVGAMVTGPVDPAAQAPVIKQAIAKGVDADTLVFGPGTDQVNASQYAVGQALAETAATYIKTKLGGKANVVIINQDNVPPIQPRFQAIRTVLKALPGVKIVADVTPAQQDNADGFQAMNTILQKNPHVDVVLGSDEVVQGALAALQAGHKATNQQFLGGLDGESSSIKDILQGGPYKATVGLAPAIFGYAWSEFAARWLAGENIPQAINVIPAPLTNATQIAAYNSAETNPAAVWNNKQLLSQYLGMYGSISYATRGNYLAYNWSL